MLKQALAEHGSIWWNLMDSYNTRTQIRSNASETLNAMRGGDSRSWHDHERRRYSAGHAYLKDGEQSQIPAQVAARASRIGYYLKSTIAWKKSVSMPEPVESRVTRELEFILHLSVCRTPFFDKKAFRELPERLGGRNRRFESDKVTDVWTLPTANGLDGHGAQFPVALPGRCIALSTKPGDIVLDPFVGSGTTSVAAALLRRRSIGFDVSEAYLTIAKRRVSKSLNRPAKSSYHQEYDNDNSELFQLT
jgi:DNA modification methylase